MKTDLNVMRAFIGFLVAPAIPALALYLVNVSTSQEAAPLVFLLLAPLAYSGALLFGLPAHLLMRRRRIYALWAYVFAGAAIGLLFSALFFGVQALVSFSSAPEHAVALLRNSIGSVGVAVIYAASASALFWWIAVKRSEGQGLAP